MDWTTIITIILGSGVISALLTQLLDRIWSSREEKRYNTFIGLTLAHDLEEYSWNCAEAVSDHQLAEDSNWTAGRQISKPPEVFKIPDENFRNFDIEILDQAFSFPLKVKSARSTIEFYATAVGPDEASEKAYSKTIELGEEALLLATEIRKKYTLKDADITFGKYTLQNAYARKFKWD